MSMNVGSSDGDEDEVVSAINTTPLVDVMLVLLIIFLITIPVVTHTVPIHLPKDRNQPTQTKPENIVIAVTKDGGYYWNQKPVPDIPTLVDMLKKEAVKVPQPEVHIRGDQDGRQHSQEAELQRVRSNGNGVKDAALGIEIGGRHQRENGEGSSDVHQSNQRSCAKDGPRQRPPRITNLFAHGGNEFQAGEGEGDL